MRQGCLIALVLMLAVGACTEDESPAPAPPTSSPSRSPDGETEAQIEIYSRVIRRLVTKDHTFGRGPSPFKYVYVLDDPIQDAGDPMAGNLFGPAEHPFPSDVTADIRQRLRDLPPVRFVRHGDDVRRSKQRLEGVKNDGVIISLGVIEPRKAGRVHVSNGLWCGGTCGQWLTYVLVEDEGRWRITGTTGPYAIS